MNACDTNNLPGTLKGAIQASGRDIFTEAERVNGMKPGERNQYERMMASTFGLKGTFKAKSKLDALAPKESKIAGGALDASLFQHPSEQFSKKFYSGIDKKLTKWAEGKNADYASYKEKIAKPVRQVIKALDKIAAESEGKSNRQLDRELSRFGLTTKDLYHARGYLNWLAQGGHLQPQGWAKPFVKLSKIIGRSQAALNIKWTLGNAVDMIRPASYYASKNPGAFFKGLADAAVKTKGNLFKKLPELEKAGAYETSYMDRGEGGWFDPFGSSIVAQKNVVYHLDKASGGDGLTGIREQLFDYKPWDKPAAERWAGSELVFGLVRYPINETRWFFRTTKEAFTNPRQAANLAIYLGLRTVLTGSAAQVPALLYQNFPKEAKQFFEGLDKSYGFNVIKNISGLDLTDYLQITGGQTGARAKQLTSGLASIAKDAVKTSIDVSKGNIPAAAIHSVATIMALMNYGAFAGNVSKLAGEYKAFEKAAEVAGKLEGSQLNSSTLLKLLEASGKSLEQELSAQKTQDNVLKAVFGNNTVSTPKASGI